MLRENSSAPPVVQSLLDRLTDVEPRTRNELPLTRVESLRELKQGLRRDLEWLLNTRRIAVPPTDCFREVNRSALVYGMPDLSSFSMADSDDREQLRRAIQTIVRLFEPRIGNIQVVKLEDEGTSTHVLRFRIDGLLRTQPAQPISFDTVLQIASGEYQVKGDTNAG
jgi:type VI secretion system protein ImpF